MVRSLAAMPASLAPPLAAPERAARDDLRAQIGRLDRELAELAAATYPRIDAPHRGRRGAGGPRILGLGDLERTRDELFDRLSTLRGEAADQATRQAAARQRLERMLADPPGHRNLRIANADLGLPGCTTYESRPRLGLIGMLAGWWHVKISSGCPLPWGP
jgi:hypothetical protein